MRACTLTMPNSSLPLQLLRDGYNVSTVHVPLFIFIIMIVVAVVAITQ